MAQSGTDSLLPQAAFSGLLIISKSIIPSPPPFFTNYCCLFNLWVLPSAICLLTLFIKSSGIGKTVATKVTLESAANDFTMLIFPYRVKSLEDHTLRHFSKESNLDSKFLL